MSYNWLGMRKLTEEEVKEKFDKGELAGCFRLYGDGTEAEISVEEDWDKIEEHLKAGGEIGEELARKEIILPDGKKIVAPAVVDVSGIGSFDELEYSLWGTIQEYMEMFGITMEDDDPDWATVKAVQDRLLTILMDAGVNFKFFTDEKQTEIEDTLKATDGKLQLKVSISVSVTDVDIDDIMCVALEGGITYWADEAEVTGEYLGEYGHEQIARGGTLNIHTMEPFDDDETEYYILDKEKLLKGLNRYLEDPEKPYDILVPAHNTKGYEIDTCQVDGVVADMIIQYALFGEIVYA
ncbi:MAG: hypothetical protein IJL07_09015 [Lachnospiraceae bacterium]|nr:hypothetical protein [Lachnospiraceae bacterium]